MKVDTYSITGVKKAQIELPIQFQESIRGDLIRRAVISQQSHNYQPYGSDPLAGTKQGQATPKRRKGYKTTYGHGVSRVKRKFSWRRGLRFGFVGAFVSSAIGGRKAFAPQVNKVISEKINIKERRKSIRSAIAATANKALIEKRNHQIKDIKSIPLVIEDKLETLKKAKDVKIALTKLGLSKELARTSKRKVRAGRGTTRGRKYKTKVGPLLVVSKACDAVKAARNLLGVDIVEVNCLNAELLAPGTQPGRLTVWTKSAIERLGKERLFK